MTPSPAKPTDSTGLPLTSVPPGPDLHEWAKRQFSEVEALAGLENIQQTGGVGIEELLRAFDRVAETEERVAR